ncbi:MAG TPA: MinD/ParA family protein [Candidatus Tectomicrobia bacterium]|nr:MinD/ParA family protein [Candidatus Tectomicrobia bacterium]
MPHIVSVHSYRGGTGKSNTTANLAALLAAEGRRVGVVDTDIQSPGIHILFGLGDAEVGHSLNDYLWGRCQIKETAHDVTARLGAEVPGKVFLIPSSMKPGDIARVLREGYDVGLLRDGLHELIDVLGLDVLMIDTHPGLNEETLLSIAISDVLLIVLRPDQQDYQGTSVTVEVARRLDVPRLLLVVNKVPALFDVKDVRARVEQTYACEVAAVLGQSDEMMALASTDLFVLRYPQHPITAALRQVASRLDA